MRKSAIVIATMLGFLSMAGCKPNGQANAGSVMDDVSGNEVAAAGVNMPSPSMDPVANLKAANDFLEKNKTASGVKTTPSGLQYAVTASGAGDGPMPSAASIVQVNYEGKLLDGTVFDSSVQRGEPVEFPVNGVIPGWVEALQLMPQGSKWELYIPSDLAYGPAGQQSIPPASTLIFEVELLEVKAAAAEPAAAKPAKK